MIPESIGSVSVSSTLRYWCLIGEKTYLERTARRQWHPSPVLLPGRSHGWRSLVGCSPWGRKESDTTERLHFHFSLSCIGEGNGNPLQCSCLENPRDGGAWWAAVYRVVQSRIRLKRQQEQQQWRYCCSAARCPLEVVLRENHCAAEALKNMS